MNYVAMVLTLSLLSCADAASAKVNCRSQSQKHAFDVLNGYSRGRAGYIVDHTCPLSCGGLDSTTNMQYQTLAEGRAKDRWERLPWGCRKLCNEANSTPNRQVFNCR